MASTNNQEQDGCLDMERKMELLVDGELSKEEEKEVLEQIRQCQDTFKKFDMKKKFKDFIFQKLERKCCHEEVVSLIRSELKIKKETV